MNHQTTTDAAAVVAEWRDDGKRQRRHSNIDNDDKEEDDNIIINASATDNNPKDGTFDYDLDDSGESEGISISQDPNIKYAADAFISSELAKMSVEDREAVYYDIHGISNPVEETPAFIAEKIKEFQSSVDQFCLEDMSPIPTTTSRKALEEKADGLSRTLSTNAYELALSMDSKYVHNPDLVLMFLRSERFNAKPAAKRFIHWFQIKLDLFGPTLLTKTITQQDLEKFDDTAGALYDGFKQILPLRDRAGRLVFVDVVARANLDNQRSLYAKLRRKFYCAMVCCEDIETQQKGSVVVMYAVDAKDDIRWLDYNLLQSTMAVMESLPLRTEAFHICHNNHWTWAPKVALYKLIAPIFSSLRSRAHYGGHSECLFRLQTFGIPVSVMPLTSDGKPSIDQHAALWQQRREYEQRYLSSSSSYALTTTLPAHGDDKTTCVEPILADEVPTMGPTIAQPAARAGRAVSTSSSSTTHTPELMETDESQTTSSMTQDASTTLENNDDNDTASVEATETKSSSTPTTVPAEVSTKSILFPAQFDVLLGRGRGYHCHVGNIKFRNRVEECKADYENCKSREEKKQMTLQIVQEVQQSWGGRFLRQDVTGWIIADEEEARLKVSHTFRNLKAKSIGKKNNKKETAGKSSPTKRMNPE